MSRAIISGVSVYTGLYINGSWMDGKGYPLDTENPATEEKLATIQTASIEDVNKAVICARACFEERWGLETSGIERGALIFKLADEVDKAVEELALLESLGVCAT